MSRPPYLDRHDRDRVACCAAPVGCGVLLALGLACYLALVSLW